MWIWYVKVCRRIFSKNGWSKFKMGCCASASVHLMLRTAGMKTTAWPVSSHPSAILAEKAETSLTLLCRWIVGVSWETFQPLYCSPGWRADTWMGNYLSPTADFPPSLRNSSTYVNGKNIQCFLHMWPHEYQHVCRLAHRHATCVIALKCKDAHVHMSLNAPAMCSLNRWGWPTASAAYHTKPVLA